jgi:hypothetical protein
LAALFVGGVIALISRSLAFRTVWPYAVHVSITSQAIETEFTDPWAFAWLCSGINNTDYDETKREDRALHFDSEAFQESTQRLAENLNAGIEYLDACNRPRALERFGEALHALQDFYSHSNWVENHLTPTITPSTIPICQDLVALNGSGFFVQGSLTANLQFEDPSWDHVSACTVAPGAPASVVTGGYYPNTSRPVGKCTHDEMNKDYSIPDGRWPSPRGAFQHNGTPLHIFAADVAMRHTRRIWGNDNPLTSQGIKQALTLRFPVQGAEYYNLLVRRQINVAFVIDVSGSMGDELPIVQTKVRDWVTSWMQNPEFRVNLSLVTFVDGVIFQDTSCNKATFLAWIDDLSVSSAPNHLMPGGLIDRGPGRNEHSR